jgi:hypothetical protein
MRLVSSTNSSASAPHREHTLDPLLGGDAPVAVEVHALQDRLDLFVDVTGHHVLQLFPVDVAVAAHVEQRQQRRSDRMACALIESCLRT